MNTLGTLMLLIVIASTALVFAVAGFTVLSAIEKLMDNDSHDFWKD